MRERACRGASLVDFRCIINEMKAFGGVSFSPPFLQLPRSPSPSPSFSFPFQPHKRTLTSLASDPLDALVCVWLVHKLDASCER